MGDKVHLGWQVVYCAVETDVDGIKCCIVYKYPMWQIPQ